MESVCQNARPDSWMLQLLEETGNGRDINRHYYTVEEAKDALEKPVVKALLDLCRFRNQHPAFNGEARRQTSLELLTVWQGRLLACLELLLSQLSLTGDFMSGFCCNCHADDWST